MPNLLNLTHTTRCHSSWTLRDRFVDDSPLEEAVLSELVSEAKFPASWEYTGYFVRRGPPDCIVGSESRAKFNDLRANSLRIGTGNFLPPYRELNRANREILALIKESRFRPLVGDSAW